jgi:hypothetical protein
MQHAENSFTQQAIPVVNWTKMELIEDPMPIPPPPSTFHCPKCGWHKTVAPKSDVMVRDHTWFEVCPECNHGSLERTPATMVERAMAKLRDVVGK